MIGILGGMGTQAGLDFCNKLAKLNRGKLDQQYPMFVLYNKSNTPKRPENLKKYYNVLKALVDGCKMLQKNKCKFIVMPCNTAHYWYDDLKKRVKIPILSMPKEVFIHTKKICKKKSRIGLLGTEATIKTNIYGKYFSQYYNLIIPNKILQRRNVNKAIRRSGNKSKLVKKILPFIPDYNGTYIEPFVGTGAVFLNLEPQKWIINDINKELIDAWKLVRDDLDFFINEI